MRRLPRLRDDLQLVDGPLGVDGEPSWAVHDPAGGRFCRVDALAARLLRHWALSDPELVLAAVNRQATRIATPEDLITLERFLRVNNLIAGDEPGMVGVYLEQAAQLRRSRARQWLPSLLFLRLPLVRPDRFLTATLPLVRPLLTRGWLLVCLCFAVIGLVLVARQWDAFIATAPLLFSGSGLLQLAITLAIVKVLHELGHAWVATAYGCQVRTLGVALIVGFPVLYTDTTGAWKLSDRRQRLLIGSAGLLVELCLAALALFLWTFVPDGTLRSSLFLVATVTWVTSLMVNLNPMLRFDGYYLLADLIGVDNLQARSFALARWRLRELLFGLRQPPPELFRPETRRALLVYAVAAWCWRLLLSGLIALLMYQFVFKLLSVPLIVMMLWIFVLRPFVAELQVWWQLREALRMNRSLITTVMVLLAALLLLLTPWQRHVGLPAVLDVRVAQALHPDEAGQLVAVAVQADDRVEAGQLLFQLASPDLAHDIAALEIEVAVIQALLLRQAASETMTSRAGLLDYELAEQLARLRGLQARAERLAVRAPTSGRLVDVAPALSVGRWVSPSERLAQVIGDESRVIAYLRGEALWRLDSNAIGRFVPDDLARQAVPVRVVQINDTAVGTLDSTLLASTHDGPLRVHQDPVTGELVPEHALYRVILESTEPFALPQQPLRGTVRLDARPVSPAGRMGRHLAGVLIRESGF